MADQVADTPDLVRIAEAGTRGRAAAGQDPAKRDQILDGAKKCFLELGYEAASMNAITARAGVSKGTIYVYFENKQDLFAALVAREKQRLTEKARHELDLADSFDDALRRYAVTIITQLTSEDTIRAQRMVLGVIGQLPEAAEQFFSADVFSAHRDLKDYMAAHAGDAGLSIPDPERAASQFLDLSMSGIYKQRLFGNRKKEASPAEIEAAVNAALDLFVKAYGNRAGTAPE